MLQTEGRPLILGGDGRADSPGHSAKFGTYTTMELEANVVLDLQLVQVQFILFKFRVLCEKFKTSSVNIVIVTVFQIIFSSMQSSCLVICLTGMFPAVFSEQRVWWELPYGTGRPEEDGGLL